MRLRSGTRRQGLTLLEVVVSVAIFLMSMVAIWQLFLIGGDAALDVKLQARTSMLCQSKLAEASVSPDPPTGTGTYNNFQDETNKELQWKMEVEAGPAENLLMVRVWVKAEVKGGRIVESHLSQMMLDPRVRGSTLDPPAAVEPTMP